MLNHTIGSGDFDSRLMEEIRVKRGFGLFGPDPLAARSITSLMVGGVANQEPGDGTAWRDERAYLQSMARNGPTPSQFDNAKRYLTGSYL